jgi:plasmid stability protein
MATLHVRNVPEPLYERLRQRAAERNRSLSAEVIILLEEALEGPQLSQTQLLAKIRRRRSFRPAAVGAPDSTTLLREDRDR